MSDGWKDGRNRPHTNLLVASPKGSVFWKSECTVGKKYTKFIADFIGAAIEEIGAHNVVQFISDNASVYTVVGHILEDRYPTIFKTNYAAHCLDLILEDIDKLPHVKLILENARNIVKFMYRTQKILDLMRAQTNGRELKRPGKTRFASQFLCLQSILKEEQALRFLVATEEWRTTEQCRSEEGTEISSIQGNDFWKSGKELITVVEPLVKVLRLVDGDGSTMGYVYEAMDRAKESIKFFYKDNFEKYDPFWDIIDRRWDRNLRSPLHAASAYFNPQFWYKGMIRYDSEIKRGVDTVIRKMVPQSDLRIVLDKLKLYHSKDRNIFGLLAVEFLDKSHPSWHTYFWIAFIPLILLLALGTKLEHVIARLAQDVAEKHTAIQGELVVQPSDDHFWFHRPRLVLYLIHFILFQNAFELAFFFWILTTYGFDSCIMGKVGFIVPRLIIGVIIQVLCSYSTLPLYAIVTQMGSSFMKAIFDEHVQVGLVGWAQKARKRKEANLLNHADGSTSHVGSKGGVIQFQKMQKQEENEYLIELGSAGYGEQSNGGHRVAAIRP